MRLEKNTATWCFRPYRVLFVVGLILVAMIAAGKYNLQRLDREALEIERKILLYQTVNSELSGLVQTGVLPGNVRAAYNATTRLELAALWGRYIAWLDAQSLRMPLVFDWSELEKIKADEARVVNTAYCQLRSFPVVTAYLNQIHPASCPDEQIVNK